MEDLKPCPFCGGSAMLLFSQNPTKTTIGCNRCQAQITEGINRDNHASAWNTRPIEDALLAQNARDACEIAELRRERDEALRIANELLECCLRQDGMYQCDGILEIGVDSYETAQARKIIAALAWQQAGESGMATMQWLAFYVVLPTPGTWAPRVPKEGSREP